MASPKTKPNPDATATHVRITLSDGYTVSFVPEDLDGDFSVLRPVRMVIHAPHGEPVFRAVGSSARDAVATLTDSPSVTDRVYPLVKDLAHLPPLLLDLLDILSR